MQEFQQVKPRLTPLESVKLFVPYNRSKSRYSKGDSPTKFSCLTPDKSTRCEASPDSCYSIPVPRLNISYTTTKQNSKFRRIVSQDTASVKKLRNTNKDVYEYLFPNWLKERRDFQETIKKLSVAGHINIAKVCEKHFLLRHKIEKNALQEWTKDVPFFQKLGRHTAIEVCNKLRTAYYKPGDVLIQEGSNGNEIYILVEGIVEVYKKGTEGAITEITPKNTLGEQALITGSLRNATLKAKDDVAVLVLCKEDYTGIVLKQKQKERFQNIDFLRSIKLLQDWSTAKVNQLAGALFSVRYVKDAVIYNFDEKAMDFYILKEGKVFIEAVVQNRKGNRWPIGPNEWEVATTTSRYLKNTRTCTRGDYFGEKELILDVARKSRAVSKSDNTELLVLSADMFKKLFNEADKKYLINEFSQRPNTRQLELSLSRELREAKKTVDALISVSGCNELADGRNLFFDQKTRRKLKWIKGLVSRTRREYYKDLVQAQTDRSRQVSPQESSPSRIK
jgi:CRP-like cAMP-binding protein